MYWRRLTNDLWPEKQDIEYITIDMYAQAEVLEHIQVSYLAGEGWIPNNYIYEWPYNEIFGYTIFVQDIEMQWYTSLNNPTGSRSVFPVIPGYYGYNWPLYHNGVIWGYLQFEWVNVP